MPTRHRGSMILLSWLWLVACYQVPDLWATEYSSVCDGYWDVASTWDPSGIPGSNDACTVSHTVTVSTDVAVGTGAGTNAIIINPGAELRHITSGRTLAVNVQIVYA